MLLVQCANCNHSHNCPADPNDDRGLRAFLAEHTIPDATARILALNLYIKYAAWCDGKSPAATSKQFAATMRSLGYIHAKYQGRMTYQGLDYNEQLYGPSPAWLR